MSKIYDIAFRMGVLFNILLWTTLNLTTFIETRKKFAAMENSGIITYPAYGWRWGFPFPMFTYDEFFIDGFILIFNAIVYVGFGFIFGFLFKFVWSKISSRNSALK